MDIAEFLEARITEEECALLHADICDSPTAGLARSLLAECEQKRAILDDWKCAAAAEGVREPADAQGPLAVARRSMLAILAAGYQGHPDYSSKWLH